MSQFWQAPNSELYNFLPPMVSLFMLHLATPSFEHQSRHPPYVLTPTYVQLNDSLPS